MVVPVFVVTCSYTEKVNFVCNHIFVTFSVINDKTTYFNLVATRWSQSELLLYIEDG